MSAPRRAAAAALTVAVLMVLGSSMAGGFTAGSGSPIAVGQSPSVGGSIATPTTNPSAAANPSATMATASPTPTIDPTPTVSPTASAEPPLPVDPYGSAINADTLANTQVGGTNYSPQARVTFRFRAGHTGLLRSIGIYLEDGRGYSGGNGGRLEITIRADDGTAEHRPGKTLARTIFKPGNPIRERLGSRRFADPAQLEAGKLYHVVFRNVAVTPGRDFVSVNALFLEHPTQPTQPTRTETDWALLLDAGHGWKLRTGYTPILQLHYVDGSIEGVGYIEVWSRSAEPISGEHAVRQTFGVGGRDRQVTSVSVRVARRAGIGPLTIRLEDTDGRLVDEGAATPPPQDGDDWYTFDFHAPIDLVHGRHYHLVLEAPAGTTYKAVALRKGTLYGFRPPAYFGDGHAEYTTGSTWRGFDQPGGKRNTLEGDLQFIFR